MQFKTKPLEVLAINRYARTDGNQAFFAFDMALETEANTLTFSLPTSKMDECSVCEHESLFRELRRGFVGGQGLGETMRLSVIDAMPCVESLGIIPQRDISSNCIAFQIILPEGRYRLSPVWMSYKTTSEGVYFPPCEVECVDYMQGGDPAGWQQSDYPLSMTMGATAGMIDERMRGYRRVGHD